MTVLFSSHKKKWVNLISVTLTCTFVILWNLLQAELCSWLLSPYSAYLWRQNNKSIICISLNCIYPVWLNWLFRCLSSLMWLLSYGSPSMESQYQARGIFCQPSCQRAALSETRAGHKAALKYITHTLMGRSCGRALKYSSDASPVNGRPLRRISFWRISPV